MTTKIIQFQNGLKGLKKRILCTKDGKRENKESKTSLTHKSIMNYKKNTGE